jgi:AmmeMemoRadiSam system protein A
MDVLKLNKEEQVFLLNLAKKSIQHYLAKKKFLKIKPNELPSEKLKEKFGTFVSLSKNGKLRGCIGHIYPVNPVFLDVIQNAVAAAFCDNRFSPLEEGELSETKVEISVLTKPRKLIFSSPQELLKKIKPNIDGVIINIENQQATFLPQVWGQIPDKRNFLSHLCMKVGFPPNTWERSFVEVYVYQVQFFHD